MGTLAKSLAEEWARHGVRVNAIAPGVFSTCLNESLIHGTAHGKEMLRRTPMDRYGNPDEAVGAAMFLATDAAAG